MQMDDDMSDVEIGELDLQALDETCKKQAFSSISPKKIQLLAHALHKVNVKCELGIQNVHPKYLRKSMKDIKKWGRKLDL